MEPIAQPLVKPSKRRIPVSLALALAILAVPALVLANHQFNDVPTAASYHDDVEKLVGAGITSGCSAGNYCPSNPVTRGQMAQFMTRGLGATDTGVGQIAVSDADTDYVAQVGISAGSQSGGIGYVTVTGHLSLFDAHNTCPCLVEMWVEESGSLKASSMSIWFVVSDTEVNNVRAGAGSVSWTFEVPTGSDKTYALAADVTTPAVPAGIGTQGFSEPWLQGTISASYSPFGTPND